MRTALRVTGWTMVGALVVALIALVVVPRAAGWVPLTVLSGSMEPSIPTGSQIVVRTIDGVDDARRLEVGDIGTFMPRPEDLTLATHRIIERIATPDGPVFTTQGDANDDADPWEVTGAQLRGEMIYHVPYAGYMANALDYDHKRAASVAAATALRLYAARQVVGVVRDRRRA